MEVNLNIQLQENLYYLYQNWKAGKKNKINKGDCKQCNYGTGKRAKQTRGKNGVWVGTFSSLELCHDYIINRLHLPVIEPHKYSN